MWFRVLIVVLVLGVAAVLAVPYVLDLVSLPSTKQTASVKPSVPAAPPPTASQPAGAPSSATTPSQPAPGQPPPPVETAKPEPATPAEPEKTAPAAEEAKPVAKAVEPARPKMEARAKPAVTRAAAARGPYWVQVGAFRDADAAKRVAERLRADNYTVQESAKPESTAAPVPAPAPASGPTDRYNVFVSGIAPAELDSKLSAKGLTAESVAGGVVVKPSLPLRDAVTLSRELAGEGLRVQVRRAASEASPSAAPSAAVSSDGLHRVRVGSFPDRASAMVVLKELEAKGYKPFLARGTQ